MFTSGQATSGAELWSMSHGVKRSELSLSCIWAKMKNLISVTFACIINIYQSSITLSCYGLHWTPEAVLCLVPTWWQEILYAWRCEVHLLWIKFVEALLAWDLGKLEVKLASQWPAFHSSQTPWSPKPLWPFLRPLLMYIFSSSREISFCLCRYHPDDVNVWDGARLRVSAVSPEDTTLPLLSAFLWRRLHIWGLPPAAVREEPGQAHEPGFRSGHLQPRARHAAWVQWYELHSRSGAGALSETCMTSEDGLM